MKKLHVKQGSEWLPVFCRNAQTGAIVTCQDAPQKALPTLAAWGADDLEWFQNKFANHEFALMEVQRVAV